jgi:WhiB family redox-sensing transcriptional regulator
VTRADVTVTSAQLVLFSESPVVEAESWVRRHRSHVWAAIRGGWSSRASCIGSQVDADAWFPAQDAFGHIRPQDAAPARAVCSVCPVAAECLTFALAADERYGIWAGTDTATRRTLQLRLRAGEALSSVVSAGLASISGRTSGAA